MTMSSSILDRFTSPVHFFSMLGKYLSESGGSHILNETRVIENGFLTHSYQVNLMMGG